MLFSTDGTPLKEMLQAAALRRASQNTGPKPKMYYLNPDASGERKYRTLRDRLGDVYRVFREMSLGGIHPKHATPRYLPSEMRKVRALKGVGRPTLLKTNTTINTGSADMRAAIKRHGSQRKAAAALGVSLGKLQRELKKHA